MDLSFYVGDSPPSFIMRYSIWFNYGDTGLPDPLDFLELT